MSRERVTGNPGRYDDVSVRALDETGADAVVLLVVRGKKGAGLSVSCKPSAMGAVNELLPDMLREIADAIEAQGGRPDGLRVTSRDESPGSSGSS